MRIGIFFGGPSREREVSFAGGRTVYDNLSKELFTPVPVFVDSLGNFILLDWQYIYKGTIRDFFPPAQFLPPSPHQFQVYLESLGKLEPAALQSILHEVGTPLQPSEFRDYMDFAFLTLHGPFGEDGNLQGLLEWYGIPYSGAGVLPSAIGINKIAQRQFLDAFQFASPQHQVVTRDEWLSVTDPGQLMQSLGDHLGFPLVIKAPQQGSSIGVSVLKEPDVKEFVAAVERSLFIKAVDLKEWSGLSESQKRSFLIQLVDIRDGIGLPVRAEEQTIYHPETLWTWLDNQAEAGETSVALTSFHAEEAVLFESFLSGQEFSCIVVEQEDGTPLALPPTQIIKGDQVFDYRSKYLPGMSRKVTPIEVPESVLGTIRKECERLYSAIQGQVYARIDGFVNDAGEVFLNDPNTTSGMLPSSFFFHQAAEIGLNPTQFLSFIIRTSLAARIRIGKDNHRLRDLLSTLDASIESQKQQADDKVPVAVIMGGWSSERHISVESGRNIYEKLSSSAKYRPVPVFLSGKSGDFQLTALPIQVLLKDNADDIREKIAHSTLSTHPVLQKIREEAQGITQKYAGAPQFRAEPITLEEMADKVEAVFIALHGRPGEDGEIQQSLEKLGLPYNGSGVASSQVTINKFETTERLAKEGVKVAGHTLVHEEAWLANREAELDRVERAFGFPLIAKPADDGCSSAVKMIKNTAELGAFADMIFRKEEPLTPGLIDILNLKANEEFPQKSYFLVENLISKGDAEYFLEITGGLLTHYEDNGSVRYELFEPSEALSSSEILSLEEKFLAGEGQNITPARYTPFPERHDEVSRQVRQELERVARILNVEGYARIDAFVKIFPDQRVETWIIEVNSLPGMTPATAIFHQTALNDYTPYAFIDAILEYGKQRVLATSTTTA
ncbi:MAG TPA: D-alanine--D-alanine ligase [Cytophagales bacterium]|nr:D-alanine--D-alanine ligase [Cytophagales bacterium]HAP62968.1 D-alanine--D-alanine ligase [Cytophagales bacterium]